MISVMPTEFFEPQGVDADYLSFLVNEHTKTYPGTSAILRLTYWTSAATFRLIRLLKNLHPVGLVINGMVLWVDINPDGSYTRHLKSQVKESPILVPK